MTSPAIDYRPELDGLRGIAVSGVLLNHMAAKAVPGGFVGVDVFFVLSGFLITGIIQRAVDRQRFSLADFYCRRLKRLLPAAAVMVIFCQCVGALMFLPKDYADLATSSMAFTAMAANVLFYRWDDYFAGQAQSWPLLHTWSLSVEEQFYLCFPILMCLPLMRGRRRRLVALSCLLAASLATSIYQVSTQPKAAYYLLPSRAWELAAGALVAQLPVPSPLRAPRPALDWAIGLVSIAAILGPMVAYGERTPFPGLAAVIPVAGTALFLGWSTSATSVWRELVSWKPLVVLGQISYSLYLWHWPLIIFARYAWSAEPSSCPPYVPLLAGLASVPLAWASYSLVENPLRKATLSNRAVCVASVLAIAALCALGYGVRVNGGFPSRMTPIVRQYAAGMTDRHGRNAETFALTLDHVRAGRFARIGDRSESGPPRFVLWGDSHANSLMPAFDSVGMQYHVQGMIIARASTPPLLHLSVATPAYHADQEFTAAVLERVLKDRIPVVVLAARWSGYLENDLRHGTELIHESRAKQLVFQEALGATIGRLASAGVRKVWLVESAPEHRFNVPKQLAIHAMLGHAPPRGTTTQEHVARNAAVHAIFTGYAGSKVALLDLAEPLLKNSSTLTTANGRPLYFDSHHLSMQGALDVSAAVEPVFTEIMTARR